MYIYMTLYNFEEISVACTLNREEEGMCSSTSLWEPPCNCMKSKGEPWIFKWTSICFFIHQFLYFFYYSHRHTCVFLEHANSTPVPWQHVIFWKSHSCLSGFLVYTVLLISPGTFGKMAILIFCCSTHSCRWIH